MIPILSNNRYLFISVLARDTELINVSTVLSYTLRVLRAT